jgi:hypothetical protein
MKRDGERTMKIFAVDDQVDRQHARQVVQTCREVYPVELREIEALLVLREGWYTHVHCDENGMPTIDGQVNGISNAVALWLYANKKFRVIVANGDGVSLWLWLVEPETLHCLSDVNDEIVTDVAWNTNKGEFFMKYNGRLDGALRSQIRQVRGW